MRPIGDKCLSWTVTTKMPSLNGICYITAWTQRFKALSSWCVLTFCAHSIHILKARFSHSTLIWMQMYKLPQNVFNSVADVRHSQDHPALMSPHHHPPYLTLPHPAHVESVKQVQSEWCRATLLPGREIALCVSFFPPLMRRIVI